MTLQEKFVEIRKAIPALVKRRYNENEIGRAHV